MSFKPIKASENLIAKEHQILKFWQENKIFEKLLEKNKDKEKWSFLDGPITANNPMGVHHAWGRTYKDLFRRYKAMQGFIERYQNGFDCQGLWVEVEVEKELGFKTKKDIEKFGIEKFVNQCKERVLKYSQIQTDQSIRLGQWMDWDNSYFTMSDENNFAIWHFLKKCHQKNFLYKGHDVVPWCLRCGTAISQHEILAEEYQELVHRSVYLKLPLKNRDNEYLLVWTTTPWTLPANVAVAVHPEHHYILVKQANEKYYLLEKLKNLLEGDYKIIKKIKGQDLIGLEYEGPFDDLPANSKIKHQIIAWEEVGEDEGSGLVHLAPGCGQEDFALAKKEKLDCIDPIDDEGNYKKEFGWLSGKNVRNVAEEILGDLQKKGLVYKIHDYSHRYPTCWRCKEELIFRLVDEWYISMDKLRQPMMAVAKKIQWLPSFGLERELDWLKNMQDWLISKKRYWGLALPIYQCSCGNFEVIGSKEELSQKAVEGWQDFDGHSPHRPWIDKVKIKCPKCNQIVSRILDVGNPWLDAGIVPFSTLKYFEEKNYWQNWFPADFICESFPGQFRNWFYSLIAMSTVLEGTNPFKTVLGYALVRDEKGEEMHKSKGNAIWFDEAAEKMGVDVMRWLFASADPYNNLNFGYSSADEIKRRFILILKNVYSFFTTYAGVDNWQFQLAESDNILDRWILAKFNKLIDEVTENLNQFQSNQATNKIETFVVGDLSTWYLRRSRKRRDKDFYATIYQVLLNLVKLLAPFVPFLAEDLYQHLRQDNDPISVHLCDWPKAEKIDEEIIQKMRIVRELAEKGLSLRAEAGIRVRQPLGKFTINQELTEEYSDLLKDELNVLEIKVSREIKLETKITPELKEKGTLRDIIRAIQDLRKKAGLNPADEVEVKFQVDDQQLEQIIRKYINEIQKETNVKNLTSTAFAGEKDFLSYTIDNQALKLAIR